MTWRQNVLFTSAIQSHPQGFPNAPAPSAAFLCLRAFIAEQMRMSPIDQPLMLLELLGH